MDELIEIAPGMMTGLLNYQIILIDISELKPEQFQGHPVLQAVLESLQLASKGRLVAEFDRVMDRLTAGKKDPRVKGWLQSFTRYAMSVAKIGAEQIVKAFSKILSEKEANDMAKTTAEELWVGGKTEGKTEAKAEAVLIVLRERFKKVPKITENAIRQLRDPVALDSWTAYAASCQSMDDFVAALK
jgi:DNA polymerase III psi subunit